MVSLAEEIPESKLEYRPIESVQRCADALRHVAFWNVYVADRARGKKGEDTAKELSKKEFSSKKQILNALKRSNTDALFKSWRSRSIAGNSLATSVPF